MRYSTAVDKLRLVAAALDEEARTAAVLDVETVIDAVYAFGALLDGDDPVDIAEVAFVVDRPASELPWGAEPAEVRSFMERHGLNRFPLRWVCRPADRPVTNHAIRRPVRLWSADAGTDDAVLDALSARQLNRLPRLADPDPAELTARLEADAQVCLRELDVLVHGGPVDPRSIAIELYDLVWGYTDLRRALGALDDTPSVASSRSTAHAWPVDGYQELRSATRRADGGVVVALLGDRPLDEVAQVAGDGILVALAQQVDGADQLAARCAATLRERDWWGDPELAEELEATANGVTPMRRSVPVDLDELASHLDEGGPMAIGARLELATGQLWPDFDDHEAMADEPLPDDWEEPDAWLAVDPQGSREGYRDMERFTATVTDRRLADRLERALEGRGAFRRFKDVLHQHDDEWDRWRVFSDERTRGRARSWLAEHGYRPETPATPR